MKKYIFLLIAFFSSQIAIAQQIRYSDEVEEDTKIQHPKPSEDIETLTGKKGHNGGYGALFFKASRLKGQTIAMTGVKAAWVINRTVAIGFEGQGIIPASKYTGIHPDDNQKAILLGGYGGFLIEPIVFSNKLFHVTFPVTSGAGWLGYHRDWEEPFNRFDDEYIEIIDEDIFWYIEPGVAVEMNVTKNFRINLGVSKRFTQDLELIHTSSKDFDNLNYFLALKVGRF
jgi:hypothetical protein